MCSYPVLIPSPGSHSFLPGPLSQCHSSLSKNTLLPPYYWQGQTFPTFTTLFKRVTSRVGLDPEGMTWAGGPRAGSWVDDSVGYLIRGWGVASAKVYSPTKDIYIYIYTAGLRRVYILYIL